MCTMSSIHLAIIHLKMDAIETRICVKQQIRRTFKRDGFVV